MIGDFVKILADEPEKIGKVCIRTVRLILNVLIAAALYRLIIGPAKLMTVDSYSEWSDFILSGRVLIYLFFFLIAEYMISQMLEFLEYYIFRKLYKYFLKDKKNVIKSLLKSLGVIRYNKVDGDLVSGKNYSEFQKIYSSLREDNFKDLDFNKESFIAQIREIYIVFLLVYFFLIKKYGYPLFLDALIIFIYLWVLITQSVVSVIFGFFKNPPHGFLKELDTINISSIIKNQLKAFNVSSFEIPTENRLKRFRKFNHWDKEFLLAPIIHGVVVDHTKIEKILKEHYSDNRIFIFVVFGVNTEEYASLQSIYHDQLVLVTYESTEELPGKFVLAFSQVAFDFTDRN